MIRRYLEAGVLADGVVIDRHEGTPQGGPLSPLLANILLDELDREVERRGHAFCRYADDVQIYVQSQRAGERVLASITRFLERTLRLKVNHAKSAVARSGERTFLGYRIRGRAQARLGIAPESVKRAKDTIRRITQRNRGVSLDRVLRELRTFTDGWVGYFWVARTPVGVPGARRVGPTASAVLPVETVEDTASACARAAEGRDRTLAGVGHGVRRAGLVAGGRLAGARPEPCRTPRLTHLGFHSLHDRYQALAAG